MDYKTTLLMPKTDFEMKANLNIKEPVIQEAWLENKIYQKILIKNKDKKPFILHDGPPYANGNLHIGHILNKTLKDFIVRYKNFNGFYAPFNPGWDTHGLPIEIAMLKQNPDAKNLSVIERREICKQYALEQIQNQKSQFARIGLLTDFSTTYYTLNHEYVIAQLKVFKEMVKQNIVFQELKPVYWSWSSQTSLAEAEIEYGDSKSDSIYFSVVLVNNELLPKDTKLLIWTTTPWTLPANLAVAVNPLYEYCLVQVDNNYFIVCQDLLVSVSKKLKWSNYKVVKTFKGKELENLKYFHPIKDKECPVILAEYVLNTDGTGLVHNAPGFGYDDYLACKKYNIDVYCPINEFGKFTSLVDDNELVDKFYLDTNPIIIDRLKHNHALLFHEVIHHSVGFDWRTKKPIMYRATKQWFINLENVKKVAIDSLENNVKSPVQQNTNRMIEMISKRNEWCISRQRVWGVPIPIIYDENKNPIFDIELIDNIINILDKKGVNYWYSADVKEFLTPKYKDSVYSKEKDIMDVWFDSGCSHNMLAYWNLPYPADLYLEGSDQYRGWFNSSLIIGCIIHQKSPYKAILQHGFVLDENGFKMSKSKGNTTDPFVVFNKYGSDVCRLWIANSEYCDDLRIGETILNQTAEIYRKIRNSLFKYSLSILNDFDYSKHAQKIKQPYNLYVLNKLKNVLKDVQTSYDNFKFNEIIKSIYNYVLELSNWYFEFIKDYIYCAAENDLTRREIQTSVYLILYNLMIALSPIIPHTTEEVYTHFKINHKLESVHLNDWYDLNALNNLIEDIDLINYDKFFKFKDDVAIALEELRNKNEIKKNNEALVYLNPKLVSDFDEIDLKSWLMVADVKLDNNISSIKCVNANYTKCPRCWGYFDNNHLKEGLCINCFNVISNSQPNEDIKNDQNNKTNEKILILVDSACSIPDEIAKQYDIAKIPLVLIRSDHKEYLDELTNLSNSEILSMMDNNFNFTTSCTPIGLLEEFVKEKLKTYDKVIFLPVTKGYSSQYNNALLLANHFNNKFIVIDTRTAAFNIEFLAIKIRDWLNEGCSISEVLDRVERFYALNSTIFSLFYVNGLLASGRVNKTLYSILKLTKLHPIVKLDETNKNIGLSKNFDLSYKKIVKYLDKMFDKLTKKDIHKICLLSTENDNPIINEFKQYLISTYQLDEDQIVIRPCPLIFTPICGKKAYGIQIITNKKKIQ